MSLAETCGLASPAPGDVGSDEEGAPQAPEHSQKDERDQLKQVPWRVVLHVEQHQAAVTKRVDGAQDKGRHQGGKERPPQSLEREVVTHLEEDKRFTKLAVDGHRLIPYHHAVPPLG